MIPQNTHIVSVQKSKQFHVLTPKPSPRKTGSSSLLPEGAEEEHAEAVVNFASNRLTNSGLHLVEVQEGEEVK